MDREYSHDGETVRRTIQLLRAIEGFHGEWFGITMLTRQTGIPKGTIHRFLAIFVGEGVLERHLRYGKYRKVQDD